MSVCPCTIVEPCSYACSCASPVMSGGCSRCATYGSEEQQLAHARYIAEKLSARTEALALDKDWEARLYSDFDAPMTHKDVARFVRSMFGVSK